MDERALGVTPVLQLTSCTVAGHGARRVLGCLKWTTPQQKEQFFSWKGLVKLISGRSSRNLFPAASRNFMTLREEILRTLFLLKLPTLRLVENDCIKEPLEDGDLVLKNL